MARSKSSDPLKSKKLSANAAHEEIQRFNGACDAVHMNPGDTLRKLAEAFALHVETTGEITLPIKLAGAPKKGT